MDNITNLIAWTVFSAVQISTTFAELGTENVVSVSSWIPSWENDCVSQVTVTSIVPNLQVCQQLLSSCSSCCIAGYDVKTRACHVLTAEPRSIMTSGGLGLCSKYCGAAPGLPQIAWIDCGSLSTLNGTVATPNGTSFPNSAFFTCNTGYNLVGNSSVPCQADGSWSPRQPTCQIADCGMPVAPTNGLATSVETTYGRSAVFTCNTGFKVAGLATTTTSQQATCLATGNWSLVVVCEVLTCNTLSNISNGWVSMSQGNTFASVATFHCNIGYEITGNTLTRTCGSSVTWSGSSPNCNIAYCPGISSVNNGATMYADGPLFTNNTKTVRSTVTVTCNEGYYVSSGNYLRTCQDNFQWNGTDAVCSYKCGSGHTYVEGTCFVRIKSDVNWDDGRSKCLASSWKYAIVDTKAKAEEAADLVKDDCNSKGWIGLRKNKNDAYLWVNGTEYVYQGGWGKSLNSNDNECVNIKRPTKFEDKTCDTTMECVVCEYYPKQ